MKKVILILGVFGLLLASCQKLDIKPNAERSVSERTMIDGNGNIIIDDQNGSITDPNNDEDEEEIENGITDPNNDEDEDVVTSGK